MARGNRTEALADKVRLAMWKAISKGYTYRQLTYALMNDEFKFGKTYTKATAELMIHKVKEEMREYYKKEKETIAEAQFERLVNMYSDARETDRTVALNCLKEINKMCGIYTPKDVNLNIGGNIEIDFNLEREDEN